MTFETWPLLLTIPPVVAVVWLIGRNGSRTVPARQHQWSVWVRLVAVVLLLAAAAEPSLVRAVDERSVLFLLDRSDSIGVDARVRQEGLVNEALGSARPGDRIGVGVFGASLELDTALTPGLSDVDVLTEVEGAATDLGSALTAAAAILPTEGSRRIVVVSDLVETSGDARASARELADRGIAVDVVGLETSRSADALVEAIRLPATVRTGETATAVITLRSNAAGVGELVVESGEGETVTPIDFAGGSQTVEVPVEIESPGALVVRATVDAAFDTRPENDSSQAISRVEGPAVVGLVEGAPGEGDLLAAALGAGGVVVERLSSIPGDTGLIGLDAVVLVNVDRPDPESASRLASFVEDFGRGLVVVGGDRSYGLGDYHETPLEPVLPVASDPDDLVRRQPVAEVLVIDTSGSMGRCHCNNGISSEVGPVKTDIARAGATLAIDALADSDLVGVLAFSSGYDWVIPLDEKPSPGEVEDALGSLVPEGDTEIAVALEQALDELDGISDALRHIVLFTDGWDPNDANLVPIARRIADSGVTLSVLGTGEGPGSTLRRMAEVGGGRFYPGTDLGSVPEVFVEETLTVARNLATEGSFFPAVRFPSDVTESITATPPLLGYVLTRAKATAEVNLEIGQGDPLLASWQRGLGRVAAWTSDATSRWSTGWVDWDGFVGFWGAVVRDVLPVGRSRPPEVFVEDGMLTIIATADGLGDRASAQARVRAPDGATTAVPLVRTAQDTFAGQIPAPVPGAYWATVLVDDGSGGTTTVGSGAVSSYEEEFAFREPDPTLGADLAAITGGRVDPEPEAMLDSAPALGRSAEPVWSWLALAGLLLFLTDVGLRRLAFSAGDAEAWRDGVTSERRREERRVAEVEAKRSEGDTTTTASDSDTLQRLMRRKR